VLGGLLLSFFPHAPRVELHPDVFFLLVLPPLLFSSSFLMSWRDFRYNLVSIGMLAFGLVGFTVFGVAAVSHWILPGFDWRMGLVLGAVVSTTDSIAATSIAHRLAMPKRLVDVLEGESLLNDATGLLALEFSTALLVSGRTPGVLEGAGRLLYLVFASIAVGLLAGKAIHLILTRIDDASIEITVSLLAPYVAYLAAEGVHSSGVLATVACGLYLGYKRSLYFSRAARVRAEAVWDTLTFVLNGFVFVILGLQLPWILRGIRSMNLGHLVFLGGMFSGAVILLRFLWVYPGAWVSNRIRARLLRQPEPLPSPQAIFVVGWSGMRGALALAAAISLPRLIESGEPFPQRNVMIFLTFCVIFVTLVLQGLTLPPLIRRLGLAGAAGSKNVEEELGRRSMAQAALAYLEEARGGAGEEMAPVYEELIRNERMKLNVLEDEEGEQSGLHRRQYEQYLSISADVRSIERAALLNLRNQHQINDEVQRKLEREIDLIDSRFAAPDHS
jgi:monovalent cation/hydrogen antiporter